MNARLDDIELIQRCQRGEYAAFEALYELVHQRALRTAYLITRSQPAAEDAVQETFIQVWRGIGGLREAGAFRSWFYRILLATVRRLNKIKVVMLPLDLPAHDRPDLNAPAPDEFVQDAAELQELRTAISLLPDTHRIPVVLRYYSRLTDVEIASALGIPLGTVKSRLHNARKGLQQTLTRSGSGAEQRGPWHG